MKTILIIDDHPDIRRLLSVTLGGEFVILEAHDGASGLAAILTHRPQAVLLDVMMPGELDGLQVLDAIKSNPLLKDTLVVMLTARGQSTDYQEGLARGADAYFIKPFSPLRVVNWLLDNVK